jgi:hypothetical protein
VSELTVSRLQCLGKDVVKNQVEKRSCCGNELKEQEWWEGFDECQKLTTKFTVKAMLGMVEPVTTSLHFFVASTDAGDRIDL